jgi:protein-disulfide isomerase
MAGIIGTRHHFVGDKAQTVAKILESFAQQRPVAIALEGSPRLGPERAKVTIVEFSDFQCPYCKEFASALKMLQKRYSRDLALYFKHYPLDNHCNPYMQRPFHQQACELAQIGVCIEKSGKFWEMDEVLFNSGKTSATSLAKALEARGLNPGEVYSCSGESWARDRVQQDIHEGRKLGVKATPTIFVNGYRLEGSLDSYILNLLVERFLEGRKP